MALVRAITSTGLSLLICTMGVTANGVFSGQNSHHSLWLVNTQMRTVITAIIISYRKGEMG